MASRFSTPLALRSTASCSPSAFLLVSAQTALWAASSLWTRLTLLVRHRARQRGNLCKPKKFTLPLLLSTDIDKLDDPKLDYFCVPRDPVSDFSSTNYLATAPVFGFNARGPGLHTALVAQFDCLVLAFDPYNIKNGIMYAVSPFDSLGPASISSDYLTVTELGTLIFPGWRDDVNEFALFAMESVWNIQAPYPSNSGTRTPSTTPLPPSPSSTNTGTSTGTRTATPTRSLSSLPTKTHTARPTPFVETSPKPSASGGLSPGGAAAVSICVIALVGVGAFVWWSGGFAQAIARLTPPASYSSFAKNATRSSFTSSSSLAASGSSGLAAPASDATPLTARSGYQNI